MKGKRIVCLCAALAVLAILWCWRYTTLNAAFSCLLYTSDAADE